MQNMNTNARSNGNSVTKQSSRRRGKGSAVTAPSFEERESHRVETQVFRPFNAEKFARPSQVDGFDFDVADSRTRQFVYNSNEWSEKSLNSLPIHILQRLHEDREIEKTAYIENGVLKHRFSIKDGQSNVMQELSRRDARKRR